jgi:sulfopyruvate decarboxylase TPP-binding subunit
MNISIISPEVQVGGFDSILRMGFEVILCLQGLGNSVKLVRVVSYILYYYCPLILIIENRGDESDVRALISSLDR